MEYRPKFLLMGDLNKLAKYLRLLGFDAAVYKSISFHNMIRIAAKDRRIILMRSKKLAKSKEKFKRRLLVSNFPKEQLQELSDLINYDEKFIFTRCSECNKILFKIEKKKIQNIIPEYIFNHHSEFKICRHCGKIFWQGSHWLKIRKMMESLFEK